MTCPSIPKISRMHRTWVLRSLKRLGVYAIYYENNTREFSLEYKLRTLAELAKRGHTVRCLSYSEISDRQAGRFGAVEGNFTREVFLMRKIVPVMSLLIFELIASFRLLKTFTFWDAIILDPNTIVSSLPLVLIRRFRKMTPLLFLKVSTNPVPTSEGPPTFWRRAQYAVAIKFAAKCFDRLFFITPMLASVSSSQLRVPTAKIGVWPSCVDLHTFNPSSTTRSAARRIRDELGLKGRVAILYHGSITKARGIMELVAAFELLKKEQIAATLVLLGLGRKELIKYIQDNHLEDVVKLRGPVTYFEVPNFVAACDVGIVPLPDSIWWRYQFPLKLLEYLAMNLPVIVSDLPCHRWIISRSNLAIYLTGTSPQEIAQGIRDFLKSREALKPKLGRKIVTAFSANAISEMLEKEVYSSMRIAT